MAFGTSFKCIGTCEITRSEKLRMTVCLPVSLISPVYVFEPPGSLHRSLFLLLFQTTSLPILQYEEVCKLVERSCFGKFTLQKDNLITLIHEAIFSF